MVNKVSAGAFSAAITSNNELLIWGTGEFGVVAQPQKVYMDGDVKFTDMSLSKQAGTGFAVALDDKGLIYSWGSNESGELG